MLTQLQSRWLVKRHTYYDSLRLLEVHAAAQTLPGVLEAACVMATERNLEMVRARGLLSADVDAGPEDLLIVLQGDDPSALETALQAVEAALRQAPPASEAGFVEVFLNRPRSLDRAMQLLAGANVAFISVPGAYAAAEAMRALRRGLHVHLFSDNVSLEDEVALKRMAHELGLLMMGPDCGTAMLNGSPLGFANVVRRGPVGIVGASGTGMQAATVLLDRLGVGVSHAIGVGGRDLSAEVGGRMTLDALTLLEHDSSTRAILLISKLPAPATARAVLARVRESAKPVVVCFVGTGGSETIDDAVIRAAQHVGTVVPDEDLHVPDVSAGSVRLRPEQTKVRGLFVGGTLADEARFILSSTPGVEADVTDLGDDEFTLGRPHPMIDPSARAERLMQVVRDPAVGVVLCDVVLGYGSHPDPGGALAMAVRRARSQREQAFPVVIASVCGTLRDPQRLDLQEQKLRDAGVLVFPTNATAARAAAAIAAR